MPQGVNADILFPIGGVVSVSGREKQPDNTVTTEMLLNMLPFDRAGRARGGARPGTSKLWPAALVASQAITALMQTTIALDPNTVVPGTLLIYENFSAYANGGLNTAAAGVWQTRLGNGITISDTGVTVSSHTLVTAPAGTTYQTHYIPTVIVGSSYTIQATFTLDSLAGGQEFGILARMTNSGTNGGLGLIIFNGGANAKLGDPFGTVYATTAITALGSTQHTIKLTVSGNVLNGYIDGILVLTATTADYLPNSNVGWYAGGSPGNAMTMTLYQVNGGANPAYLRQTNIVATCNGSVFEGTNLVQPVVVTGGSGVLSANVLPSMCYSAGNAYIVDGSGIYVLNLTTQTLTAMVATAGTLPFVAGAPNKYPTIACIWRDRLVLAAPTGTPQNFYLSRVGTPTDWDYSVNDTAAAFLGSAATAGHIGEPITALIPFSDDQLLIGGDHNLWMMRGDPLDGGSVDQISDATGMLSKNGWCKSPDGTVYFVGSGGLFKMAPGASEPINISKDKDNEFFRNINRALQYVTLAWDRDRQGMYIFVTPVNTGTATHRWYDQRADAFFPISYPDTHGPISALVYDGDAATDRALLLGGRSGFVQQLVDTALDDDGTAINAKFGFGPVRAFGDVSEAKLTHIDVILSDLPTGIASSAFQSTLTIQTGNTAYMAANAPRQTRTKTFTTPNRQTRWTIRARGVEFYFVFSVNALGKTFGYEKAVAYFEFGGRERR